MSLMVSVHVAHPPDSKSVIRATITVGGSGHFFISTGYGQLFPKNIQTVISISSYVIS